MAKRNSKTKPARANALRVFRESAEEILSVLEQMEENADQYSGSNRKSRRQQFRDLECHIDIFHAPGSAPTSCLVPTRDLSTHGIAFLHRSYVHTGSQITVHLRDRSDNMHSYTATVMRCRYVKGMIHELGAQFVKPINLGEFVELEPLKLVMYCDDESTAQVASHQLMCAGAETTLADSPDDLVSQLKQHEFDAIVFQGEQVTVDVIKSIRSSGFQKTIMALSTEGTDAELQDRADDVIAGPVTPEIAAEVVNRLRAA